MQFSQQDSSIPGASDHDGFGSTRIQTHKRHCHPRAGAGFLATSARIFRDRALSLRVLRRLLVAGELLVLMGFGLVALASCVLIGPDPSGATEPVKTVNPASPTSADAVILSQSPALRIRGSIIGRIAVVVDTPNATRAAVDAALRAKAAELGAQEVIGIRYSRTSAPHRRSMQGEGQAVVWTRW